MEGKRFLVVSELKDSENSGVVILDYCPICRIKKLEKALKAIANPEASDELMESFSVGGSQMPSLERIYEDIAIDALKKEA